MALHGESKSNKAFLYVGIGSLAVLAPAIVIGAAIGLLPRVYVLFVGGVLLAYFGQRLVKSARRSAYFERKGTVKPDRFEKGLFATGFSVGGIEAFEASIVLVGLFPQNFDSTLSGLGSGIAVVVVASYILRGQVRKVKQTNMKVIVAAILLSFAVLWFGELLWTVLSLGRLSDYILIPLFAMIFTAIYKFVNQPFPELLSTENVDASRKIGEPTSP